MDKGFKFMTAGEYMSIQESFELPDGYVLVPVEPTKEMVVAGADEIEGVVTLTELRNAYKAMIQAAQEEE